MRWSKLKSFFKHPLVKVSYIILILLPIVFEVLEKFKVTPEFPQMVFNVFYSSVLILISFGIYSIFVPKEISNYIDYHDYVSKHSSSLIEYNPDKRKNVVLAHLDETEKEQRKQIEMLYQTIENETNPKQKDHLQERLKFLVDPLYQTCVNRFLEKEWFKKDKSGKLILMICFLLNLAGTCFAIWVSVNRINIVINHNFS